MKLRLTLLLLVSGILGTTQAQQRLAPASGCFSTLSEDYYHGLRQLFFGDEFPHLSFVALPSLQKEYALLYFRTESGCRLVAKTIIGEDSYWGSMPHSWNKLQKPLPISAATRTVTLSPDDARLIDRLFEAAAQTIQTPDLRNTTIIFDGVHYLFSYDDYSGSCHSPSGDSNCGRLAAAAEQLMKQTLAGNKKLSESLKQEIRSLTRAFKSLRRAEEFAVTTELIYTQPPGSARRVTELKINTPGLHLALPESPAISEEEALRLLSELEPKFREATLQLYLLDQWPYRTFITIVDDREPESAKIDSDANDIHLRLRRENLTVRRILSAFHEIKVPTRTMLDSQTD